ncbi:MAG: hypothetical protein LBN23_08610 [Paludibacter sp.]|jgi:hypothetical protein|nr:hypothetical protein [Paludibacter sp.]
MKYFSVFLLCTTLTANLFAADTITVRNTSFNDGFMRPFKENSSYWADLYPNFVRAAFHNATNSAEYDYDKTGAARRDFIIADLGLQIPLWSGYFSNKTFGVALELPFAIQTWMDMYQKSTAPLLNSGFMFGAPEITFLQNFRKPFLGIKNYSVKWGPFMHECTHIGEELALFRQRENLAVNRTNPSYFYSDLVITLNAIGDSPKENHGFRFGWWAMYNHDWNWYQTFADECDESKVSKPTKNFNEYFLQYQYQSKAFFSNFQGILSGEIRNKQRYIYPFYDLDTNGEWTEKQSADERVWCYKFSTGIRYNNMKNTFFSRFGLAFECYYGLNPYGQFRNRRDFLQYGFSLIFE